jgi:hypothetical protein
MEEDDRTYQEMVKSLFAAEKRALENEECS